MVPARHPVSTYRLQLRPGFGFSDASDILPYLGDLGVTDCYVSPVLKPTSGSLHGYDICDPLLFEGPSAEHLVGFGRRHESGELLVIVPRLLVSLVADASRPTGEALWTTTRIQLPDTYEARCYRHVLTGETVHTEGGPGGGWIRAADLYRQWPVAMLWAPSGVETRR